MAGNRLVRSGAKLVISPCGRKPKPPPYTEVAACVTLNGEDYFEPFTIHYDPPANGSLSYTYRGVSYTHGGIESIFCNNVNNYVVSRFEGTVYMGVWFADGYFRNIVKCEMQRDVYTGAYMMGEPEFCYKGEYDSASYSGPVVSFSLKER